MITLQQYQQEAWIVGPNMWRAGFVLNSLELISLMSGLVDVLEVFWNDKDNAVIFIVRKKNERSPLFLGGGLCGAPVNGYKRPQQSIFVTASKPSRTSRLQA